MSCGDATEHLGNGSPAQIRAGGACGGAGGTGLSGLGMKQIPGDGEGKTILCRQDSPNTRLVRELELPLPRVWVAHTVPLGGWTPGLKVAKTSPRVRREGEGHKLRCRQEQGGEGTAGTALPREIPER